LPVSGTQAISQAIDNPESAIPDAGGFYIASSTQNRIYRVAADGTLSVTAGTGTSGFSGDGGPAASAQLNVPVGVAVDAAGNLFIADTLNNRIRKVTPAGIISTVAGTGTSGFSGDGGPATSAQLAFPGGVAVDAAGNLFIADTENDCIRKVAPAGIISTVAGTGTAGFSGDGGPAAFAKLNVPVGVSVDAAGNLFIADTFNNRIRKVIPAGTISTAAGTGTSGFSGDDGPAASAQLAFPGSVVVDAAGNLFIADTFNNRIRKVTPAGIISTMAGTRPYGFSGDGGLAVSAQLNHPRGVAVDVVGNLFIADSDNNRIRKVTPAGIISTIAGNGTSGFSGDGGLAASAQLDVPVSVAVDAAGYVYIVDNNRIRKVTPAGIISTIAGNVSYGGFNGDGGLAVSAQLNYPEDVAVDGAGNLFIADTFNNRIRKVTPAGIISTVAGTETSGFGGDGGPATSARLAYPEGVAVDGAGNLFIADADNDRIRKVTAAGIISTVAGTGNFGFSGDGGPAASAQLFHPEGVAVDAAGNLFIADTYNARIRKVTFAQQAAFSIVDRGGTSWLSSGTSPATMVGYASIRPNTGSTTPSGLAIFGFRQNNVLVTEAGVPASPLLQSGRIYAEVNGPVNTGLAIANPNSQSATVSFFFTDSNGNFGNESTTIPANGQIAAFLDRSPFNGRSSLSGAFTFSSSVPIAVIALRGLTNERGEFLITTLPVADLTAAAAPGPLVFPHFADAGGWTTQIVLVNPGDSVLTGTVQFVDPSGQATTVGVNSQSNTSFAYSIPARSSQKLPTSGTATSVRTGSVRVVPAANNSAPSGLAIFSFRNGATTVAEAGVPAVPAGTAFRLYAEASGDFSHSAAGSIQTGLAVANTSTNAATVTLELSKLDGSSTGLTGTRPVPANGQVAVFLNQITGFGSLQIRSRESCVCRVLDPYPWPDSGDDTTNAAIS
jgi:sugar lactone lactonase YvrE